MTATIGSSAQPVINYIYDDADKLTSVSQNGSTTTKAYNGAAGRLKTVTLPNNLAVTHAYDKDSQVTSLTYGSLGTLTYGYDADGRRTSAGGSFARTGIPLAQTYSYNPDNSLNTVGSASVTNDSDGNVTCLGSGAGCPQFAYDARGNLAQVAASGGTLQYDYDAFGRRDVTENSAIPTFQFFLYDGPNQAASWLGTSPISDLSTYLEGTGLDELFMVNNGANESFLRDALGSTVALTDSSPALQDQYTYDPYGNTTHTSGTSANPFQFTGRENDGDGLYYMRGRYYDPAIARFISRDPIGLGGGINMYAYAGDDPIDFSDPTGLEDFPFPVYGIGAYQNQASAAWHGAEGFYGSHYGYGVVEAGLGIVLDLGSLGFGGPGNNFQGTRIANRDGVPAPVGLMLVGGPKYYELPPQSTAPPGGLQAFNACAGTFTAFNPELPVACGVTLGPCVGGALPMCGVASVPCGLYTSALVLCYRAAFGKNVPPPSQEYNVPAP